MSVTEKTPSVYAEPTENVGVLTIVLLGIANLGLWVGVVTPIQILLPQQIAALDPANKVAALGWITTCAAVAAIIACPIAGALSDRTTSRFGRRHPWILVSLVVIAVAMGSLAYQHTVFGVGASWFVVQVGINTLYAALASIVPDRVPRRQRGLVSGVVGLPLPLGLVVGGLLATEVVRDNATSYLVLAIMVLVLGVPLVLFTRDQRLAKADRPPWSTRSFVAGFWISPRRHPDFGWAAISRFAIQLSGGIGVLYLQYYLADVVGIKDPAGAVFQLMLFYTAGIVITTVTAGKLSDRQGRRKRFVIVSSVVMGAAMLILVFGSTMPSAMAAATVLGLGYGVYLAVDSALITEVLPTARDRAKDLGVINLANSAPQAFAPAIAAAVLSLLHSYSVLYALAGLLAILGAAFIQPIKSVR